MITKAMELQVMEMNLLKQSFNLKLVLHSNPKYCLKLFKTHSVCGMQWWADLSTVHSSYSNSRFVSLCSSMWVGVSPKILWKGFLLHTTEHNKSRHQHASVYNVRAYPSVWSIVGPVTLKKPVRQTDLRIWISTASSYIVNKILLTILHHSLQQSNTCM